MLYLQLGCLMFVYNGKRVCIVFPIYFGCVTNEIKCYRVIGYYSLNCNLVIVVMMADSIIMFIVDLLYICTVYIYIKC